MLEASPADEDLRVRHSRGAQHDQQAGRAADHARALVHHASAASCSSLCLQAWMVVSQSSDHHHNPNEQGTLLTREQIWSTTRFTPNLLACARLLSGRALLAMSDLACFARPSFDPCAFLLEHVCDSSQAAICVTPREITPALTSMIHSALVLTTDGWPCGCAH